MLPNLQQNLTTYFYVELLELSKIVSHESKLIALYCKGCFVANSALVEPFKQRQTNELENEWEGPWQLEDRHIVVHCCSKFQT